MTRKDIFNLAVNAIGMDNEEIIDIACAYDNTLIDDADFQLLIIHYLKKNA